MHWKLAEVCRQVDEGGLRVLSLLDKYLSRFEYVPEDFLFEKSRLSDKAFAKSVGALRRLKLVERHPTAAAYRLTYMGLDCLALASLVRRGVVTHVGPLIGTGKESVLFMVKTALGDVAAIKFYKIGRVSFKKVVRYRGYLADQPSWLEASKVAAEREYRVLESLSGHTNLVPKVWGWDRHAVVIEYIDGVDLYKYRTPRDPENMLKLILLALREAYTKVGVVHGDLSEYNVVVSVRGSEEIPYIIDWPQYVSREDPMAEVYLRRDVNTLVSFFRRKYGVSLELEGAISYIKGLSDGV